MIDPDHTDTHFTLHAAYLIDHFKQRSLEMSVSPSTIRGQLLTECLPMIEEMRKLTHEHFNDRATFILTAIDEFEFVFCVLAGLRCGQITEDRRNGEGVCPVCGTPISKNIIKSYSEEIDDFVSARCEHCTKPIWEVIDKLDSSEGFRTWAI